MWASVNLVNLMANLIIYVLVLSKLGVLAHFNPLGIFGLGNISTFWTISSLSVLNCLIYILIPILEQNVTKPVKKGFEL